MPKSADFRLLLTCVVSIFGFMQSNLVSALPTAVELGGAIVAAVEEDAAQHEAPDVSKDNLQNTPWNSGNLASTSVFNDFVELRNVSAAAERVDRFDNIDEGRGKSHKKNKMLKHLYPLLIGMVLAKTVLVPLILKTLTAISTSSFIMAKIALAASGLLALKWVFADSGRERARVEVVHLPTRTAGGSLGYNTIDWGDLSWSGSSVVDVKTTPKQHLKYIPLKGGSSGISSSSSGSNSIALQNSYPSNKISGWSAIGNKYNYDRNLDGKPFL